TPSLHDALPIFSHFPKASKAEVDFIMDHLRDYIETPVEIKDIIATWSGLRPLAEFCDDKTDTAFMSRDQLIEVGKSGFITMVGGKWTTYRKMGEDVINVAIKHSNLHPTNGCITEDLKLLGARNLATITAKKISEDYHLDDDIANHLIGSYGDQTLTVLSLLKKSHKRLLADFPFIEAEVS